MKTNNKLYIAGSLFNEAEIAQRKKEESLLREIGIENIYNPINAPCNDKSKLPTCSDIFWGDTNEILSSNIITADITNQADLGVACELGIIWTINFIHTLAKQGFTLEQILEKYPEKQLIAINSDIRKGTANNYTSDEIPIGFNQYMIGLIKDIGTIKNNFNETIDHLKNTL